MADMIKQIFKNTHPPQTTIQLSMSSQITNCVNVLPQTTKNCQCSPEWQNTLYKIIKIKKILEKYKITNSHTKKKTKTKFFF
jgi:hypothetical protein